MAEKFEVSQRTIYRDVEVLSSAGIPVYTESGRTGGICLLQNFILDKTILSADEKRELLAALQVISATSYTSGEKSLTKLPELFNVDIGNWLEIDFSRWENTSYENTKFELLKTAVIQHKGIEILYENTNSERSQRIIQPLKLSYKSKEWYLKAFCRQKQDFRIFKLNHILELKPLGQAFLPKPYPEQESDTQQKYPLIVLLFSKEVAYRVYDEFNKTQIEFQKNGSVLVSANMPVDSWLIGYLLSFGSQVEIIKPNYLKEILAKEAWVIYQKKFSRSTFVKQYSFYKMNFCRFHG